MAILSLQNVGYKVDTNEILKNINLDVNENEFITITGPSGGGKSTLLKIIATLLTATTGEIFFDGKNQDEYAITEYIGNKCHIAFNNLVYLERQYLII